MRDHAEHHQPSSETLVAVFGTAEPLPERRLLQAGRFSFVLERGVIRNVAFGSVELLRSIAFVVRDPRWGTLEYEPTHLTVENDDNRISIRFQGKVRSGEADLRFAIAYDLDAGGHLHCRVSGLAKGDFHTARTGFVVLYPLASAVGRSVDIEHPDGRSERSEFPRLVSPAQPALEIAGLSHEPIEGVRMICRFQGEVFEMEDHRNWTDASFKVYSRPLYRPRPYVIHDGETTQQSIDVRIEGEARQNQQERETRPLALRLGEPRGRLPGFGVWGGPTGNGVAETSQPLFDRLKPDHVILTVGPVAAPDALLQHAHRLRRIGFSGDVVLEAVVSGDDPEQDLSKIAREARDTGLDPVAVTVIMQPYLTSYQPDGEWPTTVGFERLCEAARKVFPKATIGGGMYSFFTELNRCRDAAQGADYITHTASPLVHDADDISVMQTIEALPDVFETVRSFAPHQAYRIGPVAIALRHNPGGVPVPDNEDGRRQVLTSSDPRWRGLYGASWMIGYAAAGAKAGLDAITFGAIAGPMAYGLDGHVEPVGEIMALLGPASRSLGLAVEIDGPSASALAWRDETGASRSIVANHTDQTIRIALPEGVTEVAVMDAASIIEGGASGDLLRSVSGDREIELDAYAVAVITGRD